MSPRRRDVRFSLLYGHPMTGEGARGAALLTGTTEPVPLPRRLTAGPLSVDLDHGNLRRIRWHGIEVLQAIAFVVRDTNWGTYAPCLTATEITQEAERFRVSYQGSVVGPDGSLVYRAQISSARSGRLRFAAEAEAPNGFVTNRSGFVVLHGLASTVGRALTVTHPSGATTETMFPVPVQPDQPALDIAGLRYEVAPGVVVSLELEGDTFEMEDQRNWTDASFKTYVRPLARGFPYRIEAGEILRQAVDLSVSGSAASAKVTRNETVVVQWGRERIGTVPRLGLYVDSTNLHETGPHLAAATAGFLQVRLDLRGADATPQLDRALELAGYAGAPLALDVVIHGRAPATELAQLWDWCARRRPRLEMLFVIPARDLTSRPSDSRPAGEAADETIREQVRRAMPGVPLVAGMPVGFAELNRNRPSGKFDVITHATQAIVHAADDSSVMDTLTAIRHVVRTTRCFAGAKTYRIGPATIGMPPTASAAAPIANPALLRTPMSREDPRQMGLFAAAFLIGYVDAAEGVDLLTLAAPTGPFGLFNCSGTARPVAAAFAGLAALSGCARLNVAHAASGRLAAVSAIAPDGPVVWLANLGADPLSVTLSGSAATRILRFDAETVAAAPLNLAEEHIPTRGLLPLDGYAFCRIR